MKMVIELKGLPANPEKARQMLWAKINEAVDVSMQLAITAVARVTPVNTGFLRNSISGTKEIYGSAVSALISPAAVYGAAVEYGTEPHWAPIEPLKLWAKRRLGDESAAYAVRWKISRHGTKGHFMFRRGLLEAKSKIIEEFGRAVTGAIALWSGIGTVVKGR